VKAATAWLCAVEKEVVRSLKCLPAGEPGQQVPARLSAGLYPSAFPSRTAQVTLLTTVFPLAIIRTCPRGPAAKLFETAANRPAFTFAGYCQSQTTTSATSETTLAPIKTATNRSSRVIPETVPRS
jgi:hypothetical protein